MSRLLIAIIRFYQNRISVNKLSRGCCRFYPTCSHYFLQALQTHGFIKGTALGTWRILRCNPFCKGGFDPVPPKKEKHKVIGKYRR